MSLEEVINSVWKQVMAENAGKVNLGDESYPVHGNQQITLMGGGF